MKYECSRCGASKVKLWRQEEWLHRDLLCVTCASLDQKIPVSEIDSDGFVISTAYYKFGSLVPAVLLEDGTFQEFSRWTDNQSKIPHQWMEMPLNLDNTKSCQCCGKLMPSGANSVAQVAMFKPRLKGYRSTYSVHCCCIDCGEWLEQQVERVVDMCRTGYRKPADQPYDRFERIGEDLA